MLWGHIHEHLTNTWFVAPQSVFTTGSPHKGASHSALCQQSCVKHDSPVPLSCATHSAFPTLCTARATTQLPTPHTYLHLLLIQQSLNSVSIALSAPGCALLKCPTKLLSISSRGQQGQLVGSNTGGAGVGKKQRKVERGRRKKIRAGRGLFDCSQMLIWFKSCTLRFFLSAIIAR